MLTPAQRNFQKKMAAKETKHAAETGNRRDLNQYELMQAQLHEHRLQLKNIQSNTAKAAKKAEILPDYDSYIAGVLEADSGLQDDVLMYVLVWSIDAKDFAKALQMAEYCIKHELAMPDAFQRTTATVVAEQIAEASLDDEIPLELLQQAEALLMAEDMPDPVKGKLHKALGNHTALQEQEPQTALNHLQSADGLMKKANVKTAIKNLQKQIAAAEEQQKEQQQPE